MVIVKLHTLLDLNTVLPKNCFITNGLVHDLNMLYVLSLPRECFLFMDKAYVEIRRLWRLTKEINNFILTAKDNVKYKVVDRGTTDKTTDVN
jgi:hypothetical protein